MRRELKGQSLRVSRLSTPNSRANFLLSPLGRWPPMAAEKKPRPTSRLSRAAFRGTKPQEGDRPQPLSTDTMPRASTFQPS